MEVALITSEEEEQQEEEEEEEDDEWNEPGWGECVCLMYRDYQTRRAVMVCVLGLAFVLVWLVPCVACAELTHHNMQLCMPLACLWPLELAGVAVLATIAWICWQDARDYLRKLRHRELDRQMEPIPQHCSCDSDPDL